MQVRPLRPVRALGLIAREGRPRLAQALGGGEGAHAVDHKVERAGRAGMAQRMARHAAGAHGHGLVQGHQAGGVLVLLRGAQREQGPAHGVGGRLVAVAGQPARVGLLGIAGLAWVAVGRARGEAARFA